MAAAALAWASSSTSTPFAGLRVFGGRSESAVAREAYTPKPAPEKFMTARYTNYDKFVYRKKRPSKVRIRMDRTGGSHQAYYRILAQHGDQPVQGGYRCAEHIGWWNPCVSLSDKDFFGLKADRACYWLNCGAEPTSAVASLFERAGLVRRTGVDAQRGEWEWRVPKESGPNPPEGWKYDGPHAVTWNNKPQRQIWNKKSRTPEEAAKVPLVEKYGFIKYTKIPLDQDVLGETVMGSELSAIFPNTELGPM